MFGNTLLSVPAPFEDIRSTDAEFVRRRFYIVLSSAFLGPSYVKYSDRATSTSIDLFSVPVAFIIREFSREAGPNDRHPAISP
jgi:hypothetical protein